MSAPKMSHPDKIIYTAGFELRPLVEDVHLGRPIAHGALTVWDMQEVANRYNQHAALLSQVARLRGSLEAVTKWAETIEVVHAHPFLNNRAIVEARALLADTEGGES